MRKPASGPADIPVIFVSACGRNETVARVLERGASNDLVKPLAVTEFTAWVRAARRGTR